MILTKICMPPRRCLPSLGSDVVVGGVWNSWAQGWLALLVLGQLPQQGSCRGRRGRPGKGFVGGVHLAPLLFVSLVLALPCFSRASVSLRLPSSALLSVASGAALTARAQVKGSKGEPLLLYTDSQIYYHVYYYVAQMVKPIFGLALRVLLKASCQGGRVTPTVLGTENQGT